MTRIKALQPAEATPKAQELLAEVKARIGMTPNMMKTMANSASVLEGYLALSGALSAGVLPAALREQIALTVAQANRCEYCLAAHTALGKMAGLGKEELEASRRATSANAKTEAALRFAQELIIHRGHIDDASLASVRAAGFTDAEITEIVTHVALNIFTNYFNVVARTEVDFPGVDLTLAA
jgi:uncharacterized peroxidase-related enzyme